ncbi:GNAT family N-acetyltransferase [Desulfosarcina sp. OttesenSCG-928-A07]|nr:GNAT family N-acetyltransferase [Desulfosarcina sp. OttesenSCG-928-G17]MDL2328246.1 GNAT family N-acetyltransferase [Desulfosarcina sp. OttesenSCG-928-A07]
MEDIQVRKLRGEDADDIAAIYADIVRKPADEKFKKLIEKHARYKDGSICLVAEKDERVVGFLMSYILELGFGVEKSAWISNLGVAVTFMGNGVGSHLIRSVIAEYRKAGVNHIYTPVIWDSTDILSFFKSQGFDHSRFLILERDIEKG